MSDVKTSNNRDGGALYARNLERWEDYEFLRDVGVQHREALRRVGWSQGAFAKFKKRHIDGSEATP